MPYSTWDELFGTDTTKQIAGIGDVKSKLRASGMILQTSENLDQMVLEIMNACSSDLKEQVEERFQKTFPEQIAYYYGVYQRAARSWDEQLFPNGFPNFGYISMTGSFVNFEDRSLTDDPQVFIHLGIPATTYNGVAYNGAFCIDTTPSGQSLYINRGTKDANDWDVFDTSDIPDYLSNPEVLRNAYIYGSCYFAFEDRTTNDLKNAFKDVELFAFQEERFCKKYERYTARGLGRLKPDVSNGGKVTSLDLRSQTKQWGGV